MIRWSSVPPRQINLIEEKPYSKNCSGITQGRRKDTADLDPESATTDRLIAMARSHREGETYPTPEQLLANLPVVLRALCDYLLTGEATALDAAYRVASIVDVVEGASTLPGSPSIRH